jgi:flagellar basal-body rod modification protein FlgD
MPTAVAGATDPASALQTYINAQQKALANDKTSSAASTSGSVTGVTGDFNTFLKILTTQLQNQDPLAATDPNQFTQELVQFSGIEQQINTNKKLDQLISAANPNGITPLLGYMGQYVEAPANGRMEVQNGTARFAYNLPAFAQKTTVEILDGKGNTVTSFAGPATAGLNRLNWDGKDASGNAVIDGTYAIKVTATDANGKAIEVSDIRLIGRVTSVQTDADGKATLSVGNTALKDADISAVFGAAAGQTQTGASG